MVVLGKSVMVGLWPGLLAKAGEVGGARRGMMWRQCRLGSRRWSCGPAGLASQNDGPVGAGLMNRAAKGWA